MKSGWKRLLIAAIALLLLVAAGVYYAAFAPVTSNYQDERDVFIARQSTLGQVTDSLSEAGILSSAGRFEFVARATGWGDQIKAGFYSIGSGSSAIDILQTLRKGLQTPVKVLIPPGVTPEVAAASAARNMEFSADEFLHALRDISLAEEAGTDTTRLPGFLLPDTYNFYWQTPPSTVIKEIKSTLDSFYTSATTNDVHGLGLSKEDVVTLASIVEWETAVEEEKPTVAGVYLNRLRDGWMLDADPTVQYAIIQSEGQKRRLFFRDYKIDHPYNTYRNRGLPPGPVTNPSRSSIQAVLQPEDHGYYFFVANIDGSHTFSRTLREHVRAANRFHEAARLRRQQAETADD